MEGDERTAEERIKAAKARSHCSACGQKGHWHRDPARPKRKVEGAKHASGGHLLAINDSACSKVRGSSP